MRVSSTHAAPGSRPTPPPFLVVTSSHRAVWCEAYSAALDGFGACSPSYLERFGSMRWLETRVGPYRAAILADLQRRVSDSDDQLHPQQVVALFLPGAQVTSFLQPVVTESGAFPHLALLHRPLEQHAWTVDDVTPPALSVGGFRLVGCLQGVLYAARDGAKVDLAAAKAALAELSRLAALPWRPPTTAELVALDRGRRRRRRHLRLAIAAITLVPLAAAAVIKLLS